MNGRILRPLAIGVVAVALMAAAAVPATASSQRPIHEAMEGYALGMRFSDDFPNGSTFDGRCSVPSQWISSSAGTGVMSHLGRVTWTTEHCFQLFAGTFGDAVLVVTAANGDRLYGTYDGIMTGETTYAETVRFTGGTGRFAGASGNVEETGWFDPVSGYMEVTGNGWISYDASDRAASH